MLDEFELKQRYRDYLREVEQAQLYQQVKGKHSNWYPGILRHLRDLYIIVGQHLKGKNGAPTDFPQDSELPNTRFRFSTWFK